MSKYLTAGKLNQRINIEQRSSTQDELGQPIETWTLVSALWASIRHPSGTQTIKAGADVSTVKASMRIRYCAGLNAGMRVTYDAKHYDIQAVLPNKAEGYIDLVCEVVQ